MRIFEFSIFNIRRKATFFPMLLSWGRILGNPSGASGQKMMSNPFILICNSIPQQLQDVVLLAGGINQRQIGLGPARCVVVFFVIRKAIVKADIPVW
jgi:hypothetical protein